MYQYHLSFQLLRTLKIFVYTSLWEVKYLVHEAYFLAYLFFFLPLRNIFNYKIFFLRGNSHFLYDLCRRGHAARCRRRAGEPAWRDLDLAFVC